MSVAAGTFLDAILAEPGEDLHRLVLADWLDENGDPGRAEFIRVQCELGRWRGLFPTPRFDTAGREAPSPGLDLRRRERRLLSALRPELTAELPTSRPDCHAWGLYLARHDDGMDDDFTVGFARGFAHTVTMPCDAWVRHGPGLVRAAPLESVRLSGCVPASHREASPFGPEGSVGWWVHPRRDAAADDSWDIRRPVGRFLRGFIPHPPSARWWRWYPDRSAALAALSAACLDWARATAPGRPGRR